MMIRERKERIPVSTAAQRQTVEQVFAKMAAYIEQLEGERDKLVAMVESHRNIVCAAYFAKGLGNEILTSELVRVNE